MSDLPEPADLTVFDFVVIGGGSAGYAAARQASTLGLKVAVVEGGREIGGLCILRGCMPSKTVLESANRNLVIQRAREFGLRAEGGINKPSFYDFALLHQLGSERLDNDSQNLLVTRDKSGALIVAVWNIVDPGTQGAEKTMQLQFSGVKPDARVTLQRVDADHGNALKTYAAMGKPQYPTPKQVAEMNAASALGAPEVKQLHHGELDLQLGVNALVLIKVER